MRPHAALAQVFLERNLELLEPAARETLMGERRREDFECNAIRCLAVVRRVGEALRDGGRVLEVGIGYGLVTTALRFELGDRVELYAVDHPARGYVGVEAFRRYLEEHAIRFEPVDLLAQSLPWPGLEFDAIVFSEMIEHLPPTEVPGVLVRLRERLRPSGRLIVTSSNLQSFHRIASLAFGRGQVLDPPFPLDYAGGTYGHLRLYDRQDMEVLLERVGLRLIDWEYLNWEFVYLLRDSPRGRALYWLQRLLPGLVCRWSTSWLLTCSASAGAPPDPPGASLGAPGWGASPRGGA